MKKQRAGQFIFLIAYSLAIFCWMFESVNYISKYLDNILYVVYALLLIVYIMQMQKFYIKDVMKLIITMTLLYISWRVSENSTIFVLYGILFCTRNVELDDIVSFDLKIKIIFMMIILFLYKVGLTDTYIVYRDNIMRSSMGFSHPNKFGAYVFSIFADYMYLYYGKLKKRKMLDIMVAGLTIIITLAFSDSRGSALSIVLLMLIYYILSRKDYNFFTNKIVKFVITYSFVFLFLFSYIIGMKYDSSNTIMYYLNKLLSGRLGYLRYFLSNYNITFFGNKLLLVSNREAIKNSIQPYILDNAYIRLLLQYGIIATTIFGYCYVKTIKKCIFEKEYRLCILLLIFAIRGLTENIMFALYMNCFLLAFSKVLFKKKERKITDEKNTT